MNLKRIYRLYRQEGFAVRRRARRRRLPRGTPLAGPTRINERGSLDFVLDTVPSAPGAASVRVWEIMSRGRGPRGGRAVPEGVHVACDLFCYCHQDTWGLVKLLERARHLARG